MEILKILSYLRDLYLRDIFFSSLPFRNFIKAGNVGISALDHGGEEVGNAVLFWPPFPLPPGNKACFVSCLLVRSAAPHVGAQLRALLKCLRYSEGKEQDASGEG